MNKILNWLFMWCGTRLFDHIVISSKDGEAVDGILFANYEKLVDEYMKIKDKNY